MLVSYNAETEEGKAILEKPGTVIHGKDLAIGKRKKMNVQRKEI